MAHFARLNENNLVVEVIVVPNEALLDENGNEDENLGIKYCQSLLGENTKWVQTSYNASFRSKYAGTGATYDEELDIFIPPKPYDSWIYNKEINEWEAPKPKPPDQPRMNWLWDENLKTWKPSFY